jgi:hypothetical protein
MVKIGENQKEKKTYEGSGINKNQSLVVDYMSEESMSERENFKNVKSSTSCCVEDIVGFTIGGISSRFWLLRKHINQMTTKEVKNLPF